MTGVQEIAASRRSLLSELFARHKRHRVPIDAVFDFPFGKAFADSATDPEVAMLRLGVFTYLGGNPDHTAVRDLLEGLSQTAIIPETEAWADAIVRVLGKRVERRDRWGFSHEELDIDHLRILSQKIPKEYEIHAISDNRELAGKLARKGGGGTVYTPEQFMEHCIGFCALSGPDLVRDLVAAALSAMNSKRAIEITIGTDKPHRRKGLATAVGASLIAYCLEKGIEPHWNAASQASARLAEKLGYVQNDFFHPYFLGGE